MIRSTLRTAAVSCAALATLFSMHGAFAQSEESQESSAASEEQHSAANTEPNVIVVEQRAIDMPLGTWTFLKPGNAEKITGTSEAKTLTDLPAGSYTLISEPPSGASAVITILSGETVVREVSSTQANIKLVGGETYTMRIRYFKTKIGSVTVNSDPQGMGFTLYGPNESVEEGTTPMSFENVPEGQYKLQYKALEGCVTPKPLADQLKAGGRVGFTINIKCATADKMRQELGPDASEMNLQVSIDGKNLTMNDVAKSAWYSSAVFDVIKKGVLSGYRNEQGELTGEFGPGNSVTIAELAKIAHKMGSVSEEAFVGQNPVNPLAVNMWATPFFASAESRGWTIFDRGEPYVDPARPATRAEVLVTLLQVLEIPLKWQTGALFTDVTVRTPYAAAVETAAKEGIVEGRTDESGKPLNLFGPNDPINRAEMAKLLVTAINKYKK